MCAGLRADHAARVGEDLGLLGHHHIGGLLLGRFFADLAVVHDSRGMVADAFTLLVVEREAASFSPRSRRRRVGECAGVVEGRLRQVHVRGSAVVDRVGVVRVFQVRRRRVVVGVGDRTVVQRFGPRRTICAVQLVRVLHGRGVLVAHRRRHHDRHQEYR